MIAGFLLFAAIPSMAQLSTGGYPATRIQKSNPADTPIKALPAPDLQAISSEDAANPVPYRFAVDIPISEDVLSAGRWTTLPDGSRACMLEITAPGAKALSLHFDRFMIPGGGRLFVSSPDGKQILGAYTSANNTPSGHFAVQLVHSDRLLIEYDEPAGNVAKAELLIGSVAYAYRGVPDPAAPDGFGGAGPCEVNINCEEGWGFQKEKKGVLRVQAYKGGSSFWCTGSLLNNTRMDGTPYVLSADHCYKGGTPDDLLEWIFYFNYDGPGCENPATPPQERAMTGAILKARGGDVSLGGSDFLLVLLKDPVPDTFDTYLNGWNRKNTAATRGVGIHHPQGDIKKVSTFTQKVTSTNWIGGSVYTHWLVTWAETLNGHGVTEGGSSGSALFDSAGMIVGNLTGGGSSCDSVLLNEPDYYGKFSYSWVSCGPDSASQLKPWLDPDNTGAEILEGKPLAVEPHGVQSVFSAWPNPTSSSFTVVAKGSSLQGPVQVTLFDSRGVVLLSDNRIFTGDRSDFDISSLAPGIYLLRISGRTTTGITKIIKY